MNFFLISAILLSFVFEVVVTQCTTSDNAHCVNWVPNGFCNNMDYSLAQRQAYCGISCGICTSSGVPIARCTADGNVNCAAWAAKGFCTAQSNATVQLYCCKTCSGKTAISTTTASPTTTTTGCKPVKQISQADLDARYCTPTTPGCAASQGWVAATITATKVTCPATATSFVRQTPDGNVNGGPYVGAECVNGMWTLIGSHPFTESFPYINACCFP